MKVKYQIEGMTCNHCAMNIQKTFKSKGILAIANLSEKSVEFDANGTEDQINQLRTVLDEEGYSLKEKIN